MNNNEIIARECIAHGIYSKEEIEKILVEGKDLPVHTISEWSDRGYSVRKGEHACITTRLWKMAKRKTKEDETHFYLAKAFLFKNDQVERRAVNG